MTVKACIKSMRLRTLPLSLSGIIAGIALASRVTAPEPSVIIFLICTTALLQILSNLSNELGDTLHGTDTAERQGIHYSIQDGEMTVPQMKRLVTIVAVLCCISGVAMTLFSFKTLIAVEPVCILALGAAAIWAAMHYTLGNTPYGYRGLGDVSVFIFFGLVAVLGAGYVYSHTIQPLWTLPAAAIGCWSIGVLNVNNIRDIKTDAATRITVALKLGLHRARVYQTMLVIAGWLLILTYTVLTLTKWEQILYINAMPFFILHLRGVWTRTDKSLDPMLPLLVISTFITAILFLICL